MMKTDTVQNAKLLLEDGTLFTGKALGKIGTTVGEICFNTGMTGYQEVFTDPSYYGQVLILNNCHIGNYGMRDEDDESDGVKIRGLICKNASVSFSRKSAIESLNQYLQRNNVVAISDIDTRSLVTYIRDKGAMNCIISSESLSDEDLLQRLKQEPSMEGRELASEVSTKEPYLVGNPESKIRISVLDFGIKRNIIRCMVERGAYLKIFPAKASMDDLNSFNPDGYFVSNGPGDPAAMDYGIEIVKKIQDSGKSMFGICLGHQLLALANNGKTYKMHHGHRGSNHPVYNKITGKSEITTQNHGFAVEQESLKDCTNIEVTHINLNDNTIEGIRLKNKDIFSVQYHPESNPGPHDSRYLFDDFFKLLRKSKELNE